MSKITLDNLSNSLKNIIEQNGLTEAQVIELIKNNISGDISQLNTSNKSSLVAAINELFQSANNGKELIATAIGEPLDSNDTFSAMSTGINGLLSTFKTNMMNNGITVNNGDKFKQLIDKIATLADNEGKGIQFASGSVTLDGSRIFQITDLGFTPSFVVYMTENDVGNRNSCLVYTSDYCYEGYRDSDESSNVFEGIFTDPGDGYYHSGIYILENGFEVREPKTIYEKNIWFAIGVGEEDTTLRDSLASILQDEGVEVTPEDDMASLIIKTDNEFQENTTILYNKMKDANYNVDSSMNMDALLNELTFKTIIEGKVTQSPSTSENSLVYSVSGLDFTPSLVYVTLGGVYEQSDVIESVYYNSIILNNRQSFVGASEYNTIKVNIKNNGFNLILNSQDGGTYTGLGWTSINGISYVAIR